jgi:hypothetical protein
LPQDLARKFALPPSLWSDAAALAEDRRVVDPVEEALPGVVSDIKSSSQGLLSVLPDGRTFIPTAVLLSFLRNHVNRQVSPHGLPGWMEKLGWSRAKKKGGGVPETRGYAK